MVTESVDLKIVESRGNDTAQFDTGVKLQINPIGSSGTELHSGYFSEEYLQKLRGTRGAKVWDEMRRSEPQVSMLMAAIMNPIKSAIWDFSPAADVDGSDAHLDLIRTVMKEEIDFETFLHEALTCIPFGFSLFEVIHNVVTDHPRLGTFNGIKSIAFRSQKTIERWILDPATGALQGVDQQTYSDVGEPVFIPSDFLLTFTVHKEGDNYEGISALRPMFGPWSRKNLYLKLAAIGIEKYAVGIPVGSIPASIKAESPELNKFKSVLNSYTSHQAAYIMKPAGWDITIQHHDFDAQKIKEMVILENTEMVNAVVANFLALGMGGGSGSFALGTDLSDFFLTGIVNYADIIRGVINRLLIPQIIKLNFGPQSAYPTLNHTGINDKAGTELSTVVSQLIAAQAIKPDMRLEEFLRVQYKLPVPFVDDVDSEDRDLEESKDDESKTSFENSETDPKQVQLSETYKKEFDKKKIKIKALMQKNLTALLDTTVKKIRSEWNKVPKSSRIQIGSNLDIATLPGMAAYRKELREALAEIANYGLMEARKETGAKSVKLSESIQLKAPEGGYYAALPPRIRKIIEESAKLGVETQAADLNKIVAFQFNSSAGSSDDLDAVINDVVTSASQTIEGGTARGMSVDAAAGNAIAQTLNQARLDFFFEPDVLDTIESFTFVNEDPISEICQELDGTTWAVGDPEIDRYSPPLHHNCKSRLYPNMKSDSGNPAIQVGGSSLTQKALDSITLSCARSH